MNEHGFIKAVHRHLPKEVYRWKIHDTYTGGVPDAFYCGPAGSLWIEYKYIQLPKRKSTIVTFGTSELQRIWLTKMQNNGQLTGLIVGWERQATVIDPSLLLSPINSGDLIKQGMPFKHVAKHIETTCMSGGCIHEHVAESGNKLA